MKSAVVVLAFVAIAGIVQSKPSMSKYRSLLKTQRGQDKAEDKGDKWPAAWFEFATLAGKCETFGVVMEMLEDVDPTENPLDGHTSILEDACHVTMGVAQHLAEDADAEKSAQAKAIVENALPVMQCVNLEATREVLLFMMAVAEIDESDSIYLKEAQPAFDACNDVFESLENEEHELIKALNELDATILNGSTRAVVKLLRRIVDYSKRR